MWKNARTLQDSVARTKMTDTLTSALIDFQEAQCFFVAAIQIATIVIFLSRSDSSQALAWTKLPPMFASVLQNLDFVLVTGMSSVLGIYLVQMCLQRHETRGCGYTMVLTTLVFAFSTFIFRNPDGMYPSFDFLWTAFKTSPGGIAACGGNPSPMTYCSRSQGAGIAYFSPSNVAHYYWSVTSFSMLLLDFALVQLNWKHAMVKFLHRCIKDRPSLNRRVPAILHGASMVYTFAWGGFQIMSFCVLGFFAAFLGNQSPRFGINTHTDSWSFGQIVAVTVWAPVLAKYIYLNLFGVKKAFDRMLPHSHHVVPKENLKPLSDQKEEEDDCDDGQELLRLNSHDLDGRPVSRRETV